MRILIALGLLLVLGGCVVEPAGYYGPYYGPSYGPSYGGGHGYGHRHHHYRGW